MLYSIRCDYLAVGSRLITAKENTKLPIQINGFIFLHYNRWKLCGNDYSESINSPHNDLRAICMNVTCKKTNNSYHFEYEFVQIVTDVFICVCLSVALALEVKQRVGATVTAII